MIFSENFKRLKMYHKMHEHIHSMSIIGAPIGFCIAFTKTVPNLDRFPTINSRESEMLNSCYELIPFKPIGAMPYWFDPLDYKTRKDILFNIQLELMNKLTKFDSWWYNNFKFLWV